MRVRMTKAKAKKMIRNKAFKRGNGEEMDTWMKCKLLWKRKKERERREKFRRSRKTIDYTRCPIQKTTTDLDIAIREILLH